MSAQSPSKPDSPRRPWPADCVERWPIARLIPYARNARKHTATDVKAVVKSIERFGFTIPVLVAEDGTIIAGHCRVLAAQKLGLAELPVMVAKGWTESERQAYVIADNQLAARATWDLEMLSSELAQLGAEGFDINVIGFDAAALAELLKMGQPPLGDPESVPEPPITPTTCLGDCWLLGEHRVVCGDSTKADDVDLALGDTRPILMVTDPPYGVEYDPAWRGRADAKKAGRAVGKVLNDDRADWRQAWALFSGDVAYIWHASLLGGIVAESLIASGFELRSQLVWVKQHFALSRGDYHWRHESCLYAVRKAAKSHWASDRKQSTVWEFPNNNSFGNADREKTWGHGTQKPIEAMRRPIDHNSQPGEAVYDPFLGSGTTVIAAELTGRICVGLELNPVYADVVVRRWCEFTGREAIHLATGKTFSETDHDRQAQSPASVKTTGQ